MADLASQRLITSQNSSFTTVDDIFAHLTIPQIQNLSKEYKQNIDNSKENLHTLVGSKYRDLIKIAEDIDDMSAITIQSNREIAELSYKTSTSFGFSNKNAFSRFNSSIRQRSADSAREKSKITILRNLIYNKLINLDLKILSTSKPAITHTSVLVYYAKVYYSIEVTFKDLLESHKALNDKFTLLKKRFIDFIVFELSRYSVYKSSLYSSSQDKFTQSQRLSAKDLTSHQKILSDEDLEQILEDDDFAGEEPVDKFDDEEYVNVTFESYNKRTAPIVNYLISFIILNNANERFNSLEKIANWFLELRWNYLKEIILEFQNFASDEKSSSTTISVFNLLKFIENTLVYVNSYFLKPNNELIKELRAYAKPWISTNILGFKGWIDESTVSFSQTEYVKEVSSGVKLDLHIGIEAVFDFVSSILQNNSKNISELLVVFHNLVFSFRNLNHLTISNDSTSLVLESLKQENRRDEISKLLKIVTDSIFETYGAHYSKLTQISLQNSIIGSIESKLLSDSSPEGSINLFSDELVNLMDDNIEQYINVVNSLSGYSSQKDDVSKALGGWFDFFNEYSEAIQISDQSEYGKLSPNNCIGHLHGVLQKSSRDEFKLDLGEFNSEILAREFNTLKVSLNQKFWECINEFLKLVEGRLESIDKIDSWYYLLEILLIAKVRTMEFKEEKDETASAILQSIIIRLYSNIIDYVSNTLVSETMSSEIESVLGSTDNVKLDDFPLRPTLKLSNLMYRVSSFLLSSSLTSENYVFGHLFMNEHFGTLFHRTKNDWILKKLVDDQLLHAITELPKKSQRNEEEKEAESSKDEAETKKDIHLEKSNGNSKKPSNKTLKVAQVLFANIVYLVQLTEDSPVTLSHPSVSERLSSLNSPTELIDPTVSSIIVKGVAEYYRANKNIFLPLST